MPKFANNTKWTKKLGVKIKAAAPPTYKLALTLGTVQGQVCADAINEGIDAYLEAVMFKQTHITGASRIVEVEGPTLHVLVRRLMLMDSEGATTLAQRICGDIGIPLTPFHELPAFLRAYITAAFWQWDEDEQPYPVGGMDYRESGCVEELFEHLAPEALKKMAADCEKFQQENAELLEQAGDVEQNGHDLCLTRNGAGCGFWDRGYPKDVGRKLSDAAQAMGVRYLVRGDDGRIYVE